jgi:restriction system protein
MGSIIMTRQGALCSLAEDAGIRAGLVLTPQAVLDHLGRDHDLTRELDQPDGLCRIRSSEYADGVGDLLFELGAFAAPGMPSLGTWVMRQQGGGIPFGLDFEAFLDAEAVASHFVREWALTRELVGDDVLHRELDKVIGERASDLLPTLREAMDFQMTYSPFVGRRHADVEPIALDALFQSERLPANGAYFDQRFIDYLHRRFDAIDRINWRQFEGLCAEWFDRQGFRVELGPGRGDGGVDIRVWNSDSAIGAAPTIVVQCKRQRRQVEAVVVKGLYFDGTAEGAQKGMIITTSMVGKAGRKVCDLAAFPITAAARPAVRRWVAQMQGARRELRADRPRAEQVKPLDSDGRVGPVQAAVSHRDQG